MIEWGIGTFVVIIALYFLAKKFESLKNIPTEKLYQILEDEAQFRFWFKAIEELVNRGENVTYMNNKLLNSLESNRLKDRVLALESYKLIFPNVLQSIGYRPHTVPDENMLAKLAELRTK